MFNSIILPPLQPSEPGGACSVPALRCHTFVELVDVVGDLSLAELLLKHYDSVKENA